jgi:hypothetical protein
MLHGMASSFCAWLGNKQRKHRREGEREKGERERKRRLV